LDFVELLDFSMPGLEDLDWNSPDAYFSIVNLRIPLQALVKSFVRLPSQASCQSVALVWLTLLRTSPIFPSSMLSSSRSHLCSNSSSNVRSH
jgi:hypothetical protein